MFEGPEPPGLEEAGAGGGDGGGEGGHGGDRSGRKEEAAVPREAWRAKGGVLIHGKAVWEPLQLDRWGGGEAGCRPGSTWAAEALLSP